ncbi:MAG: MFS transporter [Gemmatimonadota bacterium]|nr:MFS transporter [Gemmatimonadota bacterium]
MTRDPFERPATREFVLLFASLGAFFLSISMLVPTLPLYVRDLGGDPVEVGLVAGIFSIGVLAVRPWVGKAVDTRGRRPLLILGAITATLMAPLYVVFPTILALCVVRIVHGAGLSAYTTATTTLVTDLSPADRRTEYLGYLSTGSILAFAFGPPIGIEIAERAGWSWLFLAAGACAAVSVGCGAALARVPRPDHGDGPVDYRKALLRREVVIPTATLLLVTLVHGGVFTFLPIRLEETLAFNLGFFFLAYSGASLVVRLVAGRISRAWGDGPMVWGGLAIYALGVALLPLIRDPVTLLLGASALGVGFGVYQPAVYGLVANAASDRTRGMVFSVFLGAFDLGIALGGLASGPVVAAAGIPALLLALAVVPLLAAILFVGAMGWRPEPQAPVVVAPAEAGVP